jgi:hypothetical protein
MEITRKEKRAAILAFCEGVTKGYSTPRGSGFCTIEREDDPDSSILFIIRVNDGKKDRPMTYLVLKEEHVDGGNQTDFLYCILGLETHALMEAARRVCNESMADGAVTTQSELGVLSDGFEKALGQLQEIVDQYEK